MDEPDFFKTMPLVSVEQPSDLPDRPLPANSRSGLDPAYCLRSAKVLFGQYRKDEAHDPEVFSAAVAAVFSEYTVAIIEFAIDPRTGIAGKYKFLPHIFEIKEFCEEQSKQTERLEYYRRLPKFKPSEPTPLLKHELGQSFQDMMKTNGRPVGRFEHPDDQWNRNRLATPYRPLPTNAEIIEREYAKMGKQPVKIGGLLVSPALARKIGAEPKNV